MDIVRTLNGITQLGATWVLWFLVCLSVVGLAVAIERAVALLGSRDDMERLGADLANHLARGDAEKARSARSSGATSRSCAPIPRRCTRP